MGSTLSSNHEAQALASLVQEINPGDQDWNFVVDLLRSRTSVQHLRHYHYTIQVNRIFRITPSETIAGYQAEARKLGRPAQLFHGTSPVNAQRVILGGFQLPKHAGMFGKGLYFAKDSLKSVNYAPQCRRPNDATASEQERDVAESATLGRLVGDMVGSAAAGLGMPARTSNISAQAPDSSTGTASVAGSRRTSQVNLWRAAFGDRAAIRDDVCHMLLCDVYLGKCKTLRSARNNLNPTKEFSRSRAARCFGAKDYCSIRAPGGVFGAVRVTEFIVYNPYQAIPRFLLEFERLGGVDRPPFTSRV